MKECIAPGRISAKEAAPIYVFHKDTSLGKVPDRETGLTTEIPEKPNFWMDIHGKPVIPDLGRTRLA
jgi:hypothetical protein